MLFCIIIWSLLVFLIILGKFLHRKRGKRIKTGEQILIFNTYNTFIEHGSSISEATQGTSDTLKFSPNSVRIVKRVQSGIIESPDKRRTCKKFRKWTPFQQNVIISTIQECRNNKHLFTIRKKSERSQYFG